MDHCNMLSEIHVNASLRSWRFKLMIIRIYTFEVFGLYPFWSYTLADTDGNKTDMILPPREAHRFSGMEKGEGNWIDIHNVEIQHTFTGFKPVSCPYRLAVTDLTRIYPIAPLANHHYMEFKTIHEIKQTTNLDVPVDTMGVVFNVQSLEVPNDPKMAKIVFHIRDNIGNQIRCVATGDAAYGFQEEYDQNMGACVVIVVLKMWKISKLEKVDAETWLKTYKGFSDLRINPRMREVDDFRRELANNDPNVPRNESIVPI